MRKILTATALVATLSLVGPASALGELGVRLGTGISMWDLPDGASEPETTPFAVGAAWRLSFMPISIEVDALYWMTSGEKDASAADLALPIIGKFGFPVLPGFLDLEGGLGLEPRFALSATDAAGNDVKDSYESMVWYLPIVVGAGLDLKLIKLGLDIRYERQITNAVKGKAGDDVRHHQLMFMAGAFF